MAGSFSRKSINSSAQNDYYSLNVVPIERKIIKKRKEK
jgi:hypothetical protein